MSRNHFSFTILAFLLVLLSCRSGRDLGRPGNGEIVPRTEAGRLYESLTNGDAYPWYSGKARFRASTQDGRVSASLNLRMVHDSAIWANIEKLGIEVARVLITPDSVFVIDRVNKEYMEKSLHDFLRTYGVQMSFSDLQNTLTGKMIALSPAGLESRREDGFDVLVVRDPYGVVARHWISSSVPVRLTRSHLVDNQGRRLEIQNHTWMQMKDGTETPLGRVMAFEDRSGRTELEITFSEISIEAPSAMPFSIPRHYARVR